MPMTFLHISRILRQFGRWTLVLLLCAPGKSFQLWRNDGATSHQNGCYFLCLFVLTVDLREWKHKAKPS